jgi:hypothetical protein
MLFYIYVLFFVCSCMLVCAYTHHLSPRMYGKLTASPQRHGYKRQHWVWDAMVSYAHTCLVPWNQEWWFWSMCIVSICGRFGWTCMYVHVCISVYAQAYSPCASCARSSCHILLVTICETRLLYVFSFFNIFPLHRPAAASFLLVFSFVCLVRQGMSLWNGLNPVQLSVKTRSWGGTVFLGVTCLDS